MRVLLINPVYFDPVVYPPVNLAYIAASLKQAGEEVRVLDTNIEHECIDAIKRYEPALIGLPVMSFSDPIVAGYIRRLKKISPARILLGGAHACIMQEKILQSHPEADYAIYGEGEKAVCELCEVIKAQRHPSSVEGLIYRENGKIIKNEPRKYNRALDELPFPAWELFDVDRYKFLPIVDSRGCPYRCNFCCVKDVQGRAWRGRSWENIIEELERNIRDFGHKRYYIDGDNLFIDKGRILRLCEEIQKRKIDIEWVATQGVRADLVTGEILDAMQASGCNAIGFGIESGDSHVLESIGKGETRKQIEDAVRMAKEKGFYVTACFMVGNVGDTLESIKRSIDFMKSLRLDAVYVNLVVPYPGTELWEWVEGHGIGFNKDAMYFPPTLQCEKVDPAFETKEFTREERVKAYRMFQRAVFWSILRQNIFSRSLLRILYDKLKNDLENLFFGLTGKNRSANKLNKCDLWREIK